MGFAPVDQPSIAIAVFIEDGGDVGEAATGGGVAAPVAKAVMERWLAMAS
jgi:peptidoglycan glycosyltransferase